MVDGRLQMETEDGGWSRASDILRRLNTRSQSGGGRASLTNRYKIECGMLKTQMCSKHTTQTQRLHCGMR